uniref:Putative peptidoglycan-binding lytic transglycosylase n=1 Tax=Leptospirillum ferrodiazotrophum TaxID=412449 RepID=C6HW22_9BACT|nr:MAG: putative peptidoglycan-binding lytic transglycosylase [Leptospirillum ferrodiazotrophum]
MRPGQRRKLQALGAMALFLLASCATGTGGNASTASSAPSAPRNESRIPLLSRLFFHHSSPAPAPVTPPPVKAVSTPPPVPAPRGLFSNIPDDPSIQLYMDYFEYAQHRQFKKWLERSHEFLPTIRATFRQEGLPEDLAYLSLIESGFSSRAYSRSGAAGLWQFMRGTGIKYGLQVNWWIDQRRDPVLATRSAALYLKDLHEEFGSWALALAAYNAGEGRVANAVARTGTKDYWKIRQTRAFSRETRNYVPKFIAAMRIAKDPAKYGFTDLDYHSPVTLRQEVLHHSVEIRRLSRAMNMSVLEFLTYNPQFIRWATPPKIKDVSVNVPSTFPADLASRLASLPPSGINPDVPVYRVESGDSLWSIAHRFHTTVADLVAANRLESRRLRLRQKLVIPREHRHGSSRRGAVLARNRHLSSPKGSRGWLDHRIRPGDSLYRLAHHYRTSVRDIIALNHIPPRRTLRVGDHIMIPVR